MLPVVLAVVAGWMPIPAAAVDGGGDAGASSTHYAESLAHAADPNEFVPGGRVQVGYQPRAGLRRQIDGAPERALPGGRLSGLQMLSGGAGRGHATPRAMSARPAGPAGQDPPAVDGPVVVEPQPSETPGPIPSDGTGDPAVVAEPVPVIAPGSLQRQVIGFLPYWELNDPALTLRYDLLSTIAYFSVGVDSMGNLIRTNTDGSASTGWAGWTSSRMTTIIESAHAAGVRVALTLTLFAWSSSDAARQAAVLGSESARQNLADQTAAAVRDRGADGVNVDMEPIASGNAANFAAFIRQLRASLDAIAPGYEITVDTTGEINNYPLEDLVAPGAADAIFIMGYDYRGSSSTSAGSIAPIAGPAYDLTETLNAFLARVPADRLILGLPYYGRAWSTVSDAPNAKNQSGTQYGGSVAAIYNTAASLAADNGRRYDALEQSAWTAYTRETCTTTYGCVTSWRELYYDDAESLGAKYDLVNQRGLRGTGMWALGYDGRRPELWQALASHFTTPGSVPAEGPVLALTASQPVITWGDAVTLQADFGSLGAGRIISFQASRDGFTFNDIGSQVADVLGRASMDYRPSDNRYYRAVFQGAADLAPRQSTDVRVVVRQIALLRPLLPGTVKVVQADRTITFSTTVRPSRPELPVPIVRYVLFQLTGRTWTQVATADVVADGAGIATWPVTFSGRAAWYVRSMAIPNPVNANSSWSAPQRYDSR